MAKNDLFDFDAVTAGNNSDVAGVSVAEGTLAGNLNDAIRALMCIIARAAGDQGSDIASSGTTAIAAAGTSLYAKVTGTTTITALGTVAAGTFRIIEFTGILTLTHNASSLILPGSINITTAAGDVAMFVSLGSGNWKCVAYQTASGSPVGGFSSVTATSMDAGAGAGPDISAFRNSASPADNDLLGRYLFEGRDDASNQQTYASIEAKALDVSSGTEDAEGYLKSVVAGTLAARLTWGQGVQIGSPTGGDKGTGTLNVDTAIYRDGALIDGFGFQLFHAQDQKSSGTDGGTFTQGAWRTRTLNTSVTNEISGASLASSHAALPVGTYYAQGQAPGSVVGRHQLRIQNTTDGTTLVTGSNAYSSAGSTNNSLAVVSGRFTLTGAKNVELQHQCEATRASTGFGESCDFDLEVYADLKIWKIA